MVDVDVQSRAHAYKDTRKAARRKYHFRPAGADHFGGGHGAACYGLGAGLRLEDLSASRAFNVQRVHSFPAYSKFSKAVKAEAGHTYAVPLNASDKRGLFLFTASEYVPNKRVRLGYAVKSYQVTPGGRVSAPGFSWGQKSAG